MIEAVNEKLLKKSKKGTKKRRGATLLFLLATVFLLLYLFYVNVVSVQLANECEKIIKSESVSAVNDAVIISLDLFSYGDLVKIERGSGGEITSVFLDADKSNRIGRTVSDTATKLLRERVKNGIPVPVGSFSGFRFLSGIGQEIYMKVVSVENVVADFRSEFLSAGINQTLHRVLLNLTVTTDVLIPSMYRKTVVSTELLLSENVIIGKIPDVYLQK